jgi:hypothetical protein
MTITTNPSRNEYTATASQTVFNYTYKIYASTELDVYVTPVGQTPDDAVDITTDYVVDSGTIGNAAGGFITFNTPLASGDAVTIVSSIPYDRTVDYQNNGDFIPGTVNNDNDRQVSQIKQVLDDSDRTLAFQQTTQGASNLTLPSPESQKFLRWKSDLTGMENVSTEPIVTSLNNLSDVTIDTPTASSVEPIRVLADLNSDGTYTVADFTPAARSLDDLTDVTIGSPAATGAATIRVLADLNSDGTYTVADWTPPLAPDKKQWPTIAYDVTDSEHDIVFSSGSIPDSSGEQIITLTTDLTKKLDATWAAGDNAGGLFSGTVAADTAYDCFVIVKDSDGSVDCGYDTDLNAANIPTGYTAYHRIHTFETDGSANIRGFVQYGDYIEKEGDFLAVSSTPPTSDTDIKVGPLGSVKIVKVQVRYNTASGNNNSYIESKDKPLTRVRMYNSSDLTPSDNHGQFDIVADSLGEIHYKSSAATGTYSIWLMGWSDDRSE